MSLVVSPLRNISSFARAGNAPKLAQSYLREYGRIRPYSRYSFWQKDSRSSCWALLKLGVRAKSAQLLRFVSQGAAHFKVFVRRRAALASSASRAFFVGFLLVRARLLRCSLRVLRRFVLSCGRDSGGCLRVRCAPALVKVRARAGANARCKSPTTG